MASSRTRTAARPSRPDSRCPQKREGTQRPADHYGGFVVGIVVILTGIRVARDSSLDLVDTMPSPELTREISAVARSVEGVQGIDKVFARKTGLQYHIDLHIEVDPALTVAASHAIGGRVRATLKRELPWVADALIHVEPSSQ